MIVYFSGAFPVFGGRGANRLCGMPPGGVVRSTGAVRAASFGPLGAEGRCIGRSTTVAGAAAGCGEDGTVRVFWQAGHWICCPA
jgi:hypothetical protein